jgi:regulator of protease activity HflC (stomatin/prohibitin superfamily)
MSIWMWLVILLVIGGVIAVAWGAMTRDGANAVGGGVLAIVLAALLFFLAGFKEVPVKTVGVMASFGHVEGYMGPGIHHTWPWKTVNLLPQTVQTVTWSGGFTKGGVCMALGVRIGGQQEGCLDATIQYEVRDQAAGTLFADYNTANSVVASPACPKAGAVLNDICNAVVVREFEVAVNDVLGDYQPIQDVALTTGTGNSQFSTFAPQILALMRRDIGSQITVRTVLMPFLHYDRTTQDRLDAIQQQYAATAIADQQLATNRALAKANGAIGAVTPAELIQECLGIVQDAEKTGYQLPAGFGNCISGSSAAITVGR